MTTTPASRETLIQRLLSDIQSGAFDDPLGDYVNPGDSLDRFEITARLASFNVFGSYPKPAYLAGQYQRRLRGSQEAFALIEELEFHEPLDPILMALGDLASFDCFNLLDTPVLLDAALYDRREATRLARSVLTQYMDTYQSVPTQRDRDATVEEMLDSAVPLILLSENSELEDRLRLIVDQAFDGAESGSLTRSRIGEYRKLMVRLFTAGSDRTARWQFRQQVRSELSQLRLGRFRFLEPYWDRDVQLLDAAQARRMAMGNEVTAPDAMRLTFTILPDDKGIGGFILERIAHHAAFPGGGRFHADPKRTEVLDWLAQWAGPERCKLYRGHRTSGYVDIGGENITEDYLVLVIDRADRAQDAVAISPAVGRHATFVVRHDVSPVPWHEVFALPKSSAGDLGARRMQFKSRQQSNPYDAMYEKVLTALQCPPDQFKERFTYSDELGEYVLTSGNSRRTLL